jgi:hypothetical protein
MTAKESNVYNPVQMSETNAARGYDKINVFHIAGSQGF